MKTVTLKQLKEDLSGWAEKAAHGEVIQVTKYNRPYVVLKPTSPDGLRMGSRYGKGQLTSVLKNGTNGMYLRFLEEDRGE